MLGPRRRAATSLLATILLAAGLAGCAGLLEPENAPIRYYVLTSTPAAPSAAAAGVGPAVGVAPVRLPLYLDHRSIATRTGANELDLAENDHWAAPLDDAVTDVLVETLASTLASDRVIPLPTSAALPLDYEVQVDLVAFEQQPDGRVRLAARWAVTADDGRTLVALRRSEYWSAAPTGDYAETAAAMSALLGALAREIAGELPSLTG